MMNVKINNLPTKLDRYQWIVCRAVDGDVWFYGAWYHGQEADAHAQAREVEGFVVENTAWLKP